MNKSVLLRSILLVVFFVVWGFTFYSFFVAEPPVARPPAGIDEKFDERLLVINSCEQLDSIVSDKFRKTNYDTAQTVFFIDNFLRNRFYHSYSELSLSDNWIAAVCSKIFWRDFIYPVVPCDIIKSPMAACSQQGILFQHLLDMLKIPCATIAFYPLKPHGPGHYAVSVYYSSSWHYYDTNQEPLIVDSTMPSISTIIDRKLYEKMYVKKSNIRFQEFFKTKSYKRLGNERYGKGRMYYFQSITAFLSHWLWLGLLVAVLIPLFKRFKRHEHKPAL